MIASSQRLIVTLLGRAAAPKGFYTATKAMKGLNIPKSTFYDMVERGQIKKIIPPNRSDGFYLKVDIDRMAKAQELFLLQYATEPPVFEKAEEEDIKGLYDVCLSLWGTRGTHRYDLRLARFKKNPDIFYVLKYAVVTSPGWLDGLFEPIHRRKEVGDKGFEPLTYCV